MAIPAHDPRWKVASHSGSLLKIIVQKAEAATDLGTLVQAYVEELIEEWEAQTGEDAPSFGSSAEQERWEEHELGVLHDSHKIEHEFNRTFVKEYTRLNRHATPETALEVSELPQGLPHNRVPATLLHALAIDQARRDAAEANTLRELALSRR